MIRHPEFEYCIKKIKKESSDIWIYVSDNGSGWEEDIFDWTCDEQYRGPIELLKRIQEKENWTIKNAGNLIYSYEEDINHLMFQMDDLLGFVIILRNVEKYDNAMDFIKKYIHYNNIQNVLFEKNCCPPMWNEQYGREKNR